MSTDDLQFAKRSVAYLRSQGLRPREIESALQDELECPPEVAHQLVATA